MKTAIIGSRGPVLSSIEKYVPPNTTEIVSGGAKGVDTYAAEYAKKHDIKLTVYLPEYDKYGKSAPLVRNKAIVDSSDLVIALWDGMSRGTKQVIAYCEKTHKKHQVFILK